MADLRVPITITFSKPGVQPPVYVAGTFSDPPWQSQEMGYTVDEQNNYIFHKEVRAEGGINYQYKFHIGDGDWWMVNEDVPTVTDDIGNRNNVLCAPALEANDKESELLPTDLAVSSTEEAKPTPVVMAEKLDAGEQPDVESGTDALEQDAPARVLEQPDSESQHMEETNTNALEQEDVGESRSEEAERTEPDYVVVRQQSRTPEMAAVAAEVADYAANMDQEAPTPPISDEEAGRIGFRRLSSTPIPQVADTAAEVADVAALLDRDPLPKFNLPPTPPGVDIETPGSGTQTPSEEQAPLFEHECAGLFPGEMDGHQHDQLEQISLNEHDIAVIDTEDPLLEEFPHDRPSIIERVRTVETRLDEDETSVDGVPPSPVVGNNHSEPSLSPAMFAIEECSPSLDSIAEENIEEKDELTSLPSAVDIFAAHAKPENTDSGWREDEADASNLASVAEPELEIQEVVSQPADASKLGSQATDTAPIANVREVESTLSYLVGLESPPTTAQSIEDIQELPQSPPESRAQSPPEHLTESIVPATIPPGSRTESSAALTVTVQPATPSSSTKTMTGNSFGNPLERSKSTAVEEKNERSQLKARHKQPSPSTERPITPNSIRSAGHAKSRNFLAAFWRVVFVDWLGGLILRICGGRRHTLLAITALLLITIAPALYFSR